MDPYATIKKNYIYWQYIALHCTNSNDPMLMSIGWSQEWQWKLQTKSRFEKSAHFECSAFHIIRLFQTFYDFDIWSARKMSDWHQFKKIKLQSLKAEVSFSGADQMIKLHLKLKQNFLLLLMPFKGFKHHEIFLGEVQQIKNYWKIKI